MRRKVVFIIVVLIAFPLLAQQPTTGEISADQLWSALLQGNGHFVAGKLTYDNLKEERAAVQDHQLPPVTVLACADSRVPPELAFNQSVGGLFVIRSAGNVADEFGIASIEYAIAQGYTKLIVVLGHENCGAVVASLGLGDPPTPALRSLVTRIRSSFVHIPYDAKDPANVKKAVDANTLSAAAQLLGSSIVIRDAVTAGRVKIVTAYYDMHTGAVKVVE